MHLVSVDWHKTEVTKMLIALDSILSPKYARCGRNSPCLKMHSTGSYFVEVVGTHKIFSTCRLIHNHWPWIRSCRLRLELNEVEVFHRCRSSRQVSSWYCTCAAAATLWKDIATSVAWVLTPITFKDLVPTKAKDLSLKPKTKDLPYCPRRASRSRSGHGFEDWTVQTAGRLEAVVKAETVNTFNSPHDRCTEWGM